jgi:hypothetical protein
MLGVAMPGIAPLHPGAPPEPAWSPPADAAPAAYAPPPAAEPWAPPSAPSRREPRAPAQAEPKSPALIALAAGGALALGAIAFALLWKNPPPLTAQPRADASGKDVLHLTCASCADGTQAKIDGVVATFAHGAVDVPLAHPLGVGENHLTVVIDRPGNGRDESVPLVVPVAYRVRPDLSALDASPPSLRIAVEAQPGASVAIDGKPLALGADGHASYAFDVSAECAGFSDDAKTIERTIAYTITPRGGSKDDGQVGVRVGVVPLHLDAPGTRPIVDAATVLVAGRTARGAAVTVGGKPAQVAADGSFTFAASVQPGESDLEVRASAPGMAPRTGRVHLQRVASLAVEAREFAAKAKLSISDLSADPGKHVGEPIVVAGEVIESRAASHQTVVLLDTQPCTEKSCLVRVVRPGDATLARGEHVRAFGWVTGEFKGPPPVPELEASFLLKGR